MAIASPALQGYAASKFRIRGLNPLATAIGAGIGIGVYIYENYELTSPTGGNILDRPKKGVGVIETPSNGGSNQQHQALRLANKR